MSSARTVGWFTLGAALACLVTAGQTARPLASSLIGAGLLLVAVVLLAISGLTR